MKTTTGITTNRQWIQEIFLKAFSQYEEIFVELEQKGAGIQQMTFYDGNHRKEVKVGRIETSGPSIYAIQY